MKESLVCLLLLVALVPLDAYRRGRDFARPRSRAAQESEMTVSNAGSDRCPCLSSEDLSESLQQQIMNDYLFSERDVSQDLNIYTKGSQCGFHHRSESVCQLDDDHERVCDEELDYPFTSLDGVKVAAKCQIFPQECERQFCVVDVGNCNLDYLKLNAVDKESSTLPPDSSNQTYYNTSRVTEDLEDDLLWSGYGISYATCGYLDYQSGKNRQKHVLEGTANRTVRVALLDSSAGWTGSFSIDGENFEGPWQKWRGPTLNFLQKASLQGAFSLRIANPVRDNPELNLTARSREYHNGSTSPFDLCVYVTAAGFVDLCVGDFTITQDRIFETRWIKLQTRYLYLAVPFEYGDQSVWDDVMTLFKPYQWQTWCFMLFFVVPMMTILFFWFDDGKNHLLLDYEPMSIELSSAKSDRNRHGEPPIHIELQNTPWYERFLRALSVSYLSLATRSYSVDALSTAAKINVYAFTVFLFGFGLTYTANLAAQLTVRQLSTPVDSFEEALDRNYRFCVTRKKYQAVRSFHPSIRPDRFVMGDDGLPGFEATESSDSRADVLRRIDPIRAETDERYCHGAIIPQEDLEQFNAQSLHCQIMIVGTQVAAETTGLPMSPATGSKLDDLYDYLSALESKGDFVKELAGVRPTSRCATNGMTNEESGFSIRQMGGIWLVSFSFSIIAIIVHVYSNYLCKHKLIKKDEQGRVIRPAAYRNQWGSPVNAERDAVLFVDFFTKVDETGKYRMMKNRGAMDTPVKVDPREGYPEDHDNDGDGA
ncbi:expressed unknown protein [Seminavis robusta]|uniref:Ionotropic glutamate receptor C-terminal domain-containing protein n=1 Tax=Seminavis robusta TaxID=568900 RepID=A0A9N8E2R7_9STRA|nr:expressed unknown protein [Seminavis robusta]|eukprot:Sro497_g154740.1 n/a (765) ;mRNA; f:18640-20934